MMGRFGFWVGVAAVCLAQGSAIASSSTMSPEGRRIFDAVIGNGGLMPIISQRAATRKLIDAQLRSDRPDWAKVQILLNRNFAEDMTMRRRSRAIEERLVLQLPEADRIIYLRDSFPSSSPPTVNVPSKP